MTNNVRLASMLSKEPRSERIGMRVTKSEKKLIEEMAEYRNHRSLIDYIIELVIRDKNKK